MSICWVFLGLFILLILGIGGSDSADADYIDTCERQDQQRKAAHAPPPPTPPPMPQAPTTMLSTMKEKRRPQSSASI